VPYLTFDIVVPMFALKVLIYLRLYLGPSIAINYLYKHEDLCQVDLLLPTRGDFQLPFVTLVVHPLDVEH